MTNDHHMDLVGVTCREAGLVLPVPPCINVADLLAGASNSQANGV